MSDNNQIKLSAWKKKVNSLFVGHAEDALSRTKSKIKKQTDEAKIKRLEKELEIREKAVADAKKVAKFVNSATYGSSYLEEPRLVFDPLNPPRLLHFHGIFKKFGYRKASKYVRDIVIPELEESKNRRLLHDPLIFNSPLLQSAAEAEVKYFNILKDSGALTDAFGGCPRCKAEKIYIKVVQDRSLDEGESMHMRCDKCSWSRRNTGQ